MINLKKRSSKKELLDSDDIPIEDLYQNLRELDSINTRLGGHKVSIEGFKRISGNDKKIRICEIGCGGGDNLKAIAKYCGKKNIDLHCIGIDLKKECIEFAERNHSDLRAEWIISDYQKVVFAEKPDVIFSSLFCHHFSDPDLIDMLTWMKSNCRKGFFINDLHRHTLAYYSIKILTRLFSKSYLVKHDAPLSVARGFKKKDWKILIDRSEAKAEIAWRWAFRHLIIYKQPST